jgi:hypothetical protein
MFDAYLQPIANAYAAAPELQSSATETVAGTKAWEALADDSVDRAAGIRLLLDVSETDDPEPYPDAAAMCEDIACGRFLVSNAHSEHPIWTVADNVAFRIVHDVLGHYAASIAGGYDLDRQAHRAQGREGVPDSVFYVAGFDWEGENAACAAHVRLLHTPAERSALFTECIAQTGYAIASGGFGPQKVADLISPMIDPPNGAGCEDVGLRIALSAWRRGDV